jgi:hypothetical protein
MYWTECGIYSLNTKFYFTVTIVYGCPFLTTHLSYVCMVRKNIHRMPTHTLVQVLITLLATPTNNQQSIAMDKS